MIRRFLTEEAIDAWFTVGRARWCYGIALAALFGLGVYMLVTGA